MSRERFCQQAVTTANLLLEAASMLQRPRGENTHSDFDTQSHSNLLQAGPRVADRLTAANSCPCACHMATLIMKSSGPYYKAHPLTIVLSIT